MLGDVDARRPTAGDEVAERPTPAPAAQGDLAGRVSVFVFCDLRGYTHFTGEHGADAAAALVDRLARVAGQVAEDFNGVPTGTWGDQILLQFGSARAGVRAALALRERCLDATLTDPDRPLWVGVGVDAGESAGPDEQASAQALNVGARLCAHAAAGEALASHEVTHLAGVVPGVRYTSRRPVRLKGVSGRTALVALEPAERDPQRAAELRALARRPPGRRRLTAMAAAAVVVLVLLTGLTWRMSQDRRPSFAGGGVAVLDSRGGVQSVTELASAPTAAAVGNGAVWVVQNQSSSVARLDATSGRVEQTIPVGRSPVAVAAHDDDVWVANGTDGTVTWINAKTDRAVKTIVVGSLPAGIAYAYGRVWVSNQEDATVSAIDAESGNVLRTVTVGAGPVGVTAGAGGVWVANSQDNTVSRIDPASLRVSPPIDVGAGPRSLAVLDDKVWVSNSLDQTVSRIDPDSGVGPVSIGVGDSPTPIAVSGGQVWVGNSASGSLTRIDAKRMVAAATIRLGASPTALTEVHGALWTVAKPFAAQKHVGGTLTTVQGFTNVDPQDPVGFGEPLPLVYDTLVTVHRAGGAGDDLVPDLARRLPQASDSGRAWTFEIRPGIRYSDGRALVPDDFRRGLERAFAIGHPTYLAALVGAPQCTARPKQCRLDRGVTTTSTTVTFHLVRPDPDFVRKLSLFAAAPVPPGTPFTRVQGRSQVPGTGPYRYESFGPKYASTLRRNPYFTQWSFAAKPRGYVDEIRFLSGPPMGDQIVRLDQLTADVTEVGGSPLMPVLDTRFPDRVQHAPQFGTHYLVLNTNRPPFNNPDARRALAYAVNRQAFADAWGGGGTACQLAPPSFWGHENSCLFTKDPRTREDVWSGPDLDRARQLVRRSGTRGQRVSAYLYSGYSSSGPIAVSLERTLSDIGYVASVQVAGDAAYSDQVQSRRPAAQITVNGFAVDYLGPAALYDPVLGCAGGWNLLRHCNPELDDLKDQALVAQSQEPAAARPLWQQLNHRVSDDAAIIPTDYWRRDEFVSDRVGNVQASVFWGPLLEQIWVQ
ncbi:ABC transporter substrate-binding protein [Angustibacter sp. McL0619]|uniref:ABC transporter substrate-binding protein n=1 Tax=Angustibacter sp. McL0619 TaxID=3415676 RepID=UPI003CFA5EBB